MAQLEDYLRTEYQSDKRQLERVRKVIELVLPIFNQLSLMVKAERTRTWPYRLDNGVPRPLKTFSASTHCMIAFALNAIVHGVDRSRARPAVKPVLFPAKIRAPKLPLEGLSDLVGQATADMIDRVTNARGPLVSSLTYGQDDPLTLTWLAELLLRPATGVKVDRATAKRLHRAAVNVCARGERVLSFASNQQSPRHDELPHSFLWVRVRHLAKVAAALRGPRERPLRTAEIGLETFENELHRQLGYYVIPDSRFDPAVLVFAFEGALQFDPYALSDSTIESFFQTLEDSQKRNPYWRPVTPFLANSQGMVLFPVSVEISNSLLRSWEILEDAGRPTHFSRLEALLRRYAQWLLARAERISYVHKPKQGRNETRPALGWHSEHVNEPGTIHMWETSQVLLFLVHYSSLLQRKIAAEGLTKAGLSLKYWQLIKPAADYWKSEPLAALSRVNIGGLGAVEDEGDRHYAVLARIRQKFIEQGTSKSLLLYGPPGTGKTTLAEQMAISRQWPLLIITVSDFLASGAAEVEARAKGVFQVLQEQEDIVILFDEIDQFLLDRNSERYREQTGIFQFLTPGMLTKFQDLKDVQRSIFIVATNYEERIDSAIKRQGRFDERFLLSLPDTKRRLEFLWMFLGWRLDRTPVGSLVMNAAGKRRFASSAATKDLLRQTVCFGFGDLWYLVGNRLAIQEADTWDAIAQKLLSVSASVQPAVKLNAYASRFDTSLPVEQQPFEEFAILLYLVGEGGARLGTDGEKLIAEIYGAQAASSEIAQRLPGSTRVKMAVTKMIDAGRGK